MDRLKAFRTVIGAIWVLEFEPVDEQTVKILAHYRDDDAGPLHNDTVRFTLIENDRPNPRTVVGAIINDRKYTVSNPAFVFSYKP